jgi:hypothetical protein
MNMNRDRVILNCGLLLGSVMLNGCSRAPSFEIWGSFFPDWLVCFIVAIVLTVITQLALRHFRLRLAFPVLAYGSLAGFYTFALWLIFLR